MGISRTWPRAGAHVGSINEPTKVYKCMTKQSFHNQTSDEEMLKQNADEAAGAKQHHDNPEERNKPGGIPQLKDVLRKVHNLQVAALGIGILEITVETRYQRYMPNQTCILVSVGLHGDHLSGRTFVFYQWREGARNEDELAELNQYVQSLTELCKPLAYANKT